jgi:hypothetical protein
MRCFLGVSVEHALCLICIRNCDIIDDSHILGVMDHFWLYINKITHSKNSNKLRIQWLQKNEFNMKRMIKKINWKRFCFCFLLYNICFANFREGGCMPRTPRTPRTPPLNPPLYYEVEFWESFWNKTIDRVCSLIHIWIRRQFPLCLSINKNGRIIRYQWMNQTTKRKAPSWRAVLTRTTREDKRKTWLWVLILSDNC